MTDDERLRDLWAMPEKAAELHEEAMRIELSCAVQKHFGYCIDSLSAGDVMLICCDAMPNIINGMPRQRALLMAFAAYARETHLDVTLGDW